jgi:ubiquinone/menaquinone biosynthesis C-methylase UbiE
MPCMGLGESALEFSWVYRLWQAPFAEQKFEPVLRHNQLDRVRRVLDVACGPGTNAEHFSTSEYLGIDFNERYVEEARRRHKRAFEVADARKYSVNASHGYDFVLINSFLHHLDTPDVRAVLANLRKLLTPDGHIHILELVLPEQGGVARTLARWDRGKFARPLHEWRGLFNEMFQCEVFEPYCLQRANTALWNMVYFKGRV